MRPLLVGEVNPRSSDPRLALYPWPAGGAGARLAAHLGLSPREYLEKFDRANLWGEPLPADTRATGAGGREAARELLRRRRPRALVLLGRRVATAFGFEDAKMFSLRVMQWKGASIWVAVVPHPSGRCREWNDPRARARLRELVDQLTDKGDPS